MSKSLFRGLYRSCECGCGTLIPIINKRNKRFLRFVNYHQSRGPNNPNFKGVTTENNKYDLIYSPKHPFKDYKNRVRKHRLILEQYLSKKYNMTIFILPYFDVHHIDGNTHNNDPLNLMPIPRRQHASLHFTKDKSNRKCSTCGSKTTYMEKRKNGKLYPHWHGDGRGGYWCVKCNTKNRKNSDI